MSAKLGDVAAAVGKGLFAAVTGVAYSLLDQK
jgi:hypothetical protein